jgi:hypothetical protein
LAASLTILFTGIYGYHVVDWFVRGQGSAVSLGASQVLEVSSVLFAGILAALIVGRRDVLLQLCFLFAVVSFAAVSVIMTLVEGGGSSRVLQAIVVAVADGVAVWAGFYIVERARARDGKSTGK